ncbi:MAG: NUDIX domain-containing protein [Solirubrobacteraceae bacterium]|nr:NUDIX domain-containing protein [Solirubrobacteraceae bacterium]
MISAGLLLHRERDGALEVLLAHPGGPYWARRDDGAWSIPKGEVEPGEAPYAAARREFAEELGVAPPEGDPLPLGEARQRGGKRVVAWALAGDLDPETVASSTFEMEWPPRSGRRATFPEVDRVAWVDVETARRRLVPGQVPLLDALVAALA